MQGTIAGIGTKIGRDSFIEAVKFPASVVKNNSPIPASTMIMLSCDGEELRVTGTNYDIWITATADCEGDEFAAILVPPKKVLSYLQSLPDCDVNISVMDSMLELSTAWGKFSIPTAIADTFPEKPEMPEGRAPANAVPELIRRTMWSNDDFATDRGRAGGVNFDILDGKLTVATTDVRCIAIASVETDSAENVAGKIPEASARAAASALEGREISIAINQNVVSFDSPSVSVVARQLDGDARKYRKATLGDSSGLNSLAISSDDLKRCAKQAELLRTEDTCAVRISISENNLTVSGESSEGSVKFSVPASYAGGEDSRLVSSIFLSAYCRSLRSSESVSITFLEHAAEFRLSPNCVSFIAPIAE